ncbi:TetR/AcrR family transcriptional regulator [Nocardia wallacei]|uniref:TetR/AcrR family transcriptional regulator n=1 Tax=Nocardia wallacei TaxID=480035 RepID=UPI0024573064|nr:TetR/AcrR family transcriptional regulator [Nocardia wallacei]
MGTPTEKATTAQQLPSVWTRPQRARRETPALSRDQIVNEAIALLDQEGFEALSMRKLGARLDAGATSLYTHVANKDELLELVVDQAMGEARIPDAIENGDWRATVLLLSREIRATILRHPWIAVVLSSAGLALLGPNMMRVTESMLAIFEEAGFDDDTTDLGADAIFAFVVGTTSGEAATMTTIARSGLEEKEWIRRLLDATTAVSEPYPRTYRRAVEHRDRDHARLREDTFEREVGLIMDGMEAQRRRR